MHLLKLKENSEIRLINNITFLIMPYAIFLYIWKKDNKEVSLKDLKTGFGKTKDKYEKL